MEIQLLINFFVFILGSMVGSFLNVVIYRMPLDKSVVTPRSSCLKCDYMIPWYQNIPIISYCFLKGKCSNCQVKISLRYPLVELLMGVIALLMAPHNFEAQTWMIFIFYFSVAAIFLAHFLIDVEHQILPDKINIYFLLITIPFVGMTLPPHHWLIGGAIGFLAPLSVTFIYYKLRGQIGLGGGDIKLFGILGLILGPVGIINNIFLSCMLGSVIGVFLIMTKKMERSSAFAFGPFIIIAATLQIFFPEVVDYINPLQIK